MKKRGFIFLQCNGLSTDHPLRPLQKGTFCPISASGSNFNPRNIQYIPAVEIFVFLELEQKLPFCKGLPFLDFQNQIKSNSKYYISF